MPIRILFSHRKARICDKFGSATQYISILLIQVIQKFTCYIEQTYLVCKFSKYIYLFDFIINPKSKNYTFK